MSTLTKNPSRFIAITVSTLALTLTIAQALVISPPKVELTADKGETISGTFLIINDQETEQTYYTTVEHFESQGESGTPNFTDSKEGLPSWVKVDEKVTIKKGERITIPYSITVPQDADAGGHFAAIFLSTVPPQVGEGEVSVGAKLGMLMLLKVTGDIKEVGGLSAFAIKEDKKVLNSLPVNFIYKFKNDGNDRAKPEGDIVVRNTFGIEVARINANEQGGNVLPGSTRKYEARLGDKDAPAVSAPFFEKVKFQKNNFAFGLYFADIKLTFGTSGVAESSLSYFVFPWQLLTVVLVIVLVAGILLAVLLKRYNQWIIKQARQAAK